MAYQSSAMFKGHEAEYLMRFLLDLPHKILKYHDHAGLVHMLLHELSHDQAFGLRRASYLIDNPDFDSLRGVAGFCKKECEFHRESLWDNPVSFLEDMRDAEFHHSIQSFTRGSFRLSPTEPLYYEPLLSLGKDLGMQNPSVHVFDLKYGNHGIFIYEEGNKALSQTVLHDALKGITGLLGLCHA